MEATVAERGQITLPKAVRDALGLTKGTQLKVELDGSRIILRKNVDDALSRLRGRFKLADGVTTDDVMRELRGRAPGDPYLPPDEAQPTPEAAHDRRRLLGARRPAGGDARADGGRGGLRRALRAGRSSSATSSSPRSLPARLRQRSARDAGGRRHPFLADASCARPCAPARCSAATSSGRPKGRDEGAAHRARLPDRRARAAAMRRAHHARRADSSATISRA